MIAPVDGSGDWPAWITRVERESGLFAMIQWIPRYLEMCRASASSISRCRWIGCFWPVWGLIQISWRPPWRNNLQPASVSRRTSSSRFTGRYPDLIIRWHVIQQHFPPSITQVFFQLFQRLALAHDFRVIEQLAQPEVLAMPVHHV